MACVLRSFSVLCSGILLVGVSPLFSPPSSAAEPSGRGVERDLAQGILEATGVKGGLIVHLGCGDGKLTAELAAERGFFVHDLEADAARADVAQTMRSGRRLRVCSAIQGRAAASSRSIQWPLPAWTSA